MCSKSQILLVVLFQLDEQRASRFHRMLERVGREHMGGPFPGGLPGRDRHGAERGLLPVQALTDGQELTAELLGPTLRRRAARTRVSLVAGKFLCFFGRVPPAEANQAIQAIRLVALAAVSLYSLVSFLRPPTLRNSVRFYFAVAIRSIGVVLGQAFDLRAVPHDRGLVAVR